MLGVLFFGTPDFALPSFEACLKHTHILGVLSQPDRPRGRGQKVQPCAIKARALKAGLKVFSPASLRKESTELSELKNWISTQKIDLFVVTAYGNLLTQEFLDMPRLGSVNVHASLLPRWRGAAPIQRALEAGDKETGVSLQLITLALDAGDVLAEKTFAIPPNMGALELSSELAQLGGLLLSDFFTHFSEKRLKGTKQNEEAVSIAKKITKEEANWQSSWTSTESHNKVRAFNAWPQVRACIKGAEEIKLLETYLLKDGPTKLRPGQLLVTDGKVCLGSLRSSEHDPFLYMRTIKPANKAAVDAYVYFQNLAKSQNFDSTKGLEIQSPSPGHLS